MLGMKRLLCFAAIALVLSACHKETTTFVDENIFTESFEAAFEGEYQYGYESDTFTFEYFYNQEYSYWGGFAQSMIFDADAAYGKFENQYAVYNAKAASGDSFLLYYYDSYSEPCDIRFRKDATIKLSSVNLNLTTYTYASITDEDINSYARKFDEGDYLKVVFTMLDAQGEPVGEGVECYVVDYRDGKRFIADDWQVFYLGIMAYGRMRVTIETSDVGQYGPNTPLYICMDDLEYFVI
jgi:hypothetical protein